MMDLLNVEAGIVDSLEGQGIRAVGPYSRHGHNKRDWQHLPQLLAILVVQVLEDVVSNAGEIVRRVLDRLLVWGGLSPR